MPATSNANLNPKASKALNETLGPLCHDLQTLPPLGNLEVRTDKVGGKAL